MIRSIVYFLIALALFVSPFAGAASVAEDVAKLRREVFFAPEGQGVSIALRGTSQRDGSACWVRIRVSPPSEMPSFFVTARDHLGTHALQLAITPLDENSKILASDHVSVQEGRGDADDTGYVRFARLESFANAGQAGAYPTEVIVGERQQQPRWDERQLRCYSLAPF